MSAGGVSNEQKVGRGCIVVAPAAGRRHPSARAADDPGARLYSRLVWSAAAVGMVVSLVTVLLTRGAGSQSHTLQVGPAGDPGPLVQLGLTLARLVADSSAAMCVGSLAFTVFFTRPRESGRLRSLVSATGFASLRAASAWGLAWSLAALAVAFLSAALDAGLRPAQIPGLSGWARLVGYQEEPLGWLCTAVAALVVAAFARWTLTWRNVIVVLIGSVLALWPAVFAGHASSDIGHDLATAAIVLHVSAACIWMGALVRLLLVLKGPEVDPEVLMPRYNRLAWWCWGVLAGSGLVLGGVLDPGLRVTGTPYAVMVGGKLLLAGLLAAGALIALRGTVTGSRTPEARGSLWWRWTGVQLLLVASAFAVSSAQTTVAPPGLRRFASGQETLLGYRLPGPPTVLRLLMDWRVEILFAGVAVGLAALYAWAVWRLRRRGLSWPPRRSAAWLGGCLVVLVATSSGIGRYEPAMFSVHMLATSLLQFVAPLLLALGAPLTLGRRVAVSGHTGLPDGNDLLDAVASSGPVRWLTHPVVALALLVWSPFVVYFGGVFDASARFHWAHILLDGFFLVAGYLFAWCAVGVDPTPRPLPTLARLGMLLAAMPFSAVFATLVLSSRRVLGNALSSGNMYSALQLPWAHDLSADQRIGALIGLGVGELTLFAALATLLVRWSALDADSYDWGSLDTDVRQSTARSPSPLD